MKRSTPAVSKSGKGPAKLRIVQAISSHAWGGRERVPLLLARGLRDRGHDVSIWADPDAPAAAEAVRLGFPLHPFRWKGHGSFGAIRQIVRNLQIADPQVLHLHMTKDLWMTVPALQWAGWKNPLFLTKHVGSSVRKKDPLHEWLYRRVDRVFTCSSVIRKNVLATTPVSAEKVEVSYAPVDMDLFRFDAEKRKQVRASWNVRKHQWVVGMASRISPGKGHETLMKAAALIRAECPEVRFRMAGSPAHEEASYQRDLLKMRDRLGLKGIFEYGGYVSDVPGFLSASDLVVHAAQAEAFGLAAVEALACGRPVVGRAGEGLDEILDEGAGGIRVDSDDPILWATALKNLLKNKKQYQVLSRRARKSAMRFSLQTLVLRQERAYIEALRQKGIMLF